MDYIFHDFDTSFYSSPSYNSLYIYSIIDREYNVNKELINPKNQGL